MKDCRHPGAVEPLAELLRRHRIDAGLTQEQLAERAAISARTVSDIERGLRLGVYRDTASRLAQALGLDDAASAAFEVAAKRPPMGARASGWLSGPDGQPNVARPLTRLIGRQAEVATIVATLRSRSTRLLTVIGPGGIGKTRFAAEVAAQLSSDFADGVWFVPLGVTHDPSIVPSLIARELGLTSVRKAMQEALRDHLRDRDALLVLDTFEHILPAAAFVAELAVTCPKVTFLVTSRAPLRIRGEHELALAQLDAPDTAHAAADLDRYPATALFVERALAVKPDLVLDALGAEMIAQICQRLDGLPLALELAAARVRHLPLAAIRAALDHRLDLLVDGPRDLPSRLRAMRDAIAWSYDLLGQREQRLLRVMSVFAGGGTLTALAAIAAEETTDVFAGFAQLVDNNLVLADVRRGDEPRFGILDVIREFAAEQAAQGGQSERLARDHAAFFADLAEAAEREQGTAAQEAWFGRLELEQDNMRAALGWALENEHVEVAQRLAGALWLYWRRHGDYVEGRRWLDRALAMALPTATSDADAGPAERPDRTRALALRRKLLWGAAWISYYQADYSRVRQLGHELLELAERDGDAVAIRNGLTIKALTAMAEQRFDAALPPLERAVEICRQHCPPWLLATALLNLGQATLHGPALAARCRSVLEEALSIYSGLGDALFVARTKGYLGYAALLGGRRRQAAALFAASLTTFRDLKERFGIAEELQAISALAAANGQDERAAVLASTAQAVWTAMSAQALASDRPLSSRYLDAARARLGPTAWRAGWLRGQRMTTDAAIQLALEALSDRPKPRRVRSAGGNGVGRGERI